MSDRPELKCPICGKPRAERFKPFCSKRCAQIDLSRWFKGGYAIPAADEPDPGEAETGSGSADSE